MDEKGVRRIPRHPADDAGPPRRALHQHAGDSPTSDSSPATYSAASRSPGPGFVESIRISSEQILAASLMIQPIPD